MNRYHYHGLRVVHFPLVTVTGDDHGDEDQEDEDDEADDDEMPPARPSTGRRNSIPLLLEATAALGAAAAAGVPAESFTGKRHPSAPYRRPSLSLAQPMATEDMGQYNEDDSPEDSSISHSRDRTASAEDDVDDEIDEEVLRKRALEPNPARYGRMWLRLEIAFLVDLDRMLWCW